MTHWTYSTGALFADFGFLMLCLGCLIGMASNRKANRRIHERTRGEHYFRNVFDKHFRTWK